MASDLWQTRLGDSAFAAHAEAALKDMAVVEAANAEEEALAIAIALRQAMETEGKTAALVTPDRALARRVMAALSRWSVPVDDSGGDALADTPLGVFARLVAEAALDGLAPVKLLAMLKHPLCRADNWAVAALERADPARPTAEGGHRGIADGAAAVPGGAGQMAAQGAVGAARLRSAHRYERRRDRRRRSAGGAVAERAAAAGGAWRQASAVRRHRAAASRRDGGAARSEACRRDRGARARRDLRCHRGGRAHRGAACGLCGDVPGGAGRRRRGAAARAGREGAHLRARSKRDCRAST